MTTGTDTRNIKIIVRSLLEKYGVVDEQKQPLLQAEIDFTGAWVRYMNERKEGLTPAQVREGITAEYNVVGISEAAIVKNKLKDRMETALGLSINADLKSWEVVINHCLKKETSGETIEKFCQWCRDDIYNSPKKHQIAQNPLLIKIMWQSAFIVTHPVSTERNPAGI